MVVLWWWRLSSMRLKEVEDRPEVGHEKRKELWTMICRSLDFGELMMERTGTLRRSRLI